VSWPRFQQRAAFSVVFFMAIGSGLGTFMKSAFRERGHCLDEEHVQPGPATIFLFAAAPGTARPSTKPSDNGRLSGTPPGVRQ
jgi:hypothetical protein